MSLLPWFWMPHDPYGEVSRSVDPCEEMATPAAGDTSDSQHGRSLAMRGET